MLHCLTQDPSDPGVVHLGMADNGYFCSENGAERFRNVDWQKGISNNIKCISVSPALPNRVYAVGCQTWEWESNQVFVSIDRGRMWTRSPMLGLPDMEAHHCNSIDVDPTAPYTVYLSVSGEIRPQGGGVYRSADGGKSWQWMGEGLPGRQGFFAESIWGVGREIAAGPDGSIVCVSRDWWKAFRWHAETGAWQDVTPTLQAAPNCVVADLLQPGRFFLAADGVYVSEDGGRTWQKTFGARVEHVAADQARAGRVAAATSDGVALSVDGGRTWTMLDRSLPNRVHCRAAFAGDRLVVGTGGNGAFWMPLTQQAAEPIAAEPAEVAYVPGARVEPPVLCNGSMTGGDEMPLGWGVLWVGSGRLRAVRDVIAFKEPPASLLLLSEGGPAYGSVSYDLGPSHGPFRTGGYVRSDGELEEAVVAIQSFGQDGTQVGWQTLADGRGVRDWRHFTQPAQLPAAAHRANLVVTLRGQGRVWLDEVTAEGEPAVFLDEPLR